MNLEAWLKEEHSLDEQLRLIEGIASSLNEDHDKRILHRALEPFNVQVEMDGTCDLAGAVNADASTASAAARYRAPEVLEGASYSPQADIYAVGIILYEMLSGRNAGEKDKPAPLGELRPDIPRDLTDAIMGCLEKGPDWRPKDLSYLLQVVRTMRSGGKGGRTPPPETAARPVAASEKARRSAGGKAGRGGSPSQVPLIAAVLVLLAGAGLGGWLWFKDSGVASPGLKRSPSEAPSVLPSREPLTTATVAPLPGATKPAATPPSPNATPEPAVSTATTTPRPTAANASPTPIAPSDPTPTPVPAPNIEAAPTPAPPTPTASAAAQPAAASAEPVALTAISPLMLRRGQTTILDVHGTGLRDDHRLRIVRAKAGTPATGFSVMRQRLFNPTRIEFLVKLEDGVEAGAYSALVVDGAGGQSNALALTVAK